MEVRSDFDVVLKVAKEGELIKTPRAEQTIRDAFEAFAGGKVTVRFEATDGDDATPVGAERRQRDQAQRDAESAVRGSEQVQNLAKEFGGEIDPASVRPRGAADD